MAQDYHDIEYMTCEIIEEYRNWGLEVNTKKTEYMFVGDIQQDLTLENGITINHCQEYKYLGLKITQDGTLDKNIQERCTQGRKAIALLNTILWDQSISKENKHNIYNSIVKSIITYSSEVWPLKEKSENMLRTTEMDFWRRAAGVSRRDKIRNTRILEIMDVKHTIIDDIKTKQLRWFGHVQRMEDERLPKQVLM
ncbi:uncharacterized protein LOC122525861 [Polistes fuscatus]|uniref:uncharacterized protein LOC122521750 n=1 Tax=Polistes fuscatus TaxID=30207 RepID=UPI001CA80B4B|nr:uncharacterized protein LOC122521750 [Polistes fuscatus]XP_043504779.1 uncharacterized protein LOC122525861 [Polistes fuscatus]